MLIKTQIKDLIIDNISMTLIKSSSKDKLQQAFNKKMQKFDIESS